MEIARTKKNTDVKIKFMIYAQLLCLLLIDLLD